MFTTVKERKEELLKIIQHVIDTEKFIFSKLDDFYYTSMCEKKSGDNYILKIIQKKDFVGKKNKKECYKYFVGLYLDDKLLEDQCESLLFIEFSKNIKSISKNEFKFIEDFYRFVVEKEQRDNLCQENENIVQVEEDEK